MIDYNDLKKRVLAIRCEADHLKIAEDFIPLIQEKIKNNTARFEAMLADYIKEEAASHTASSALVSHVSLASLRGVKLTKEQITRKQNREKLFDKMTHAHKRHLLTAERLIWRLSLPYADGNPATDHNNNESKP